MGDQKPSYPTGVLDEVKIHGEERVTWETQNGLRFATVAIQYPNGYIVAARSLLETEKLIDHTGSLILLVWIACTILLTMALITIPILIGKISAKP